MSGREWRGWGVSEIGPLHIKENIPNQDSFIIKKYSWGSVGVVCDGLGSKKYSHIGSHALVHAVVKASQLFDFEKDIQLFEPLVKSLWDINISPYSQNETSTTLLFTIIKNNRIYIGRVGDGAIAIFGKKSLLVEENKDMFTNYTIPFGRDEKIEWNIFNEESVDYIVMCSDGISEDLKKEKLLDFFQNYVQNYKNMHPSKRVYEIKQWLKQWPVKGHSDDKTIVALIKADNE
ncbi:protein phosphatase 2C domain-containing protein [Sulfurimonas sp. SAG-AH-194-I05]|nr:PP2C family serine/threonine-protein phosphatase [Sulfurimonas sp. SAG-AH-194-I05]MDF1876114.1 protein phosphatase 2C domain-containing protein [Sulfurimonas sp. SAG-AH-194-I05]